MSGDIYRKYEEASCGLVPRASGGAKGFTFALPNDAVNLYTHCARLCSVFITVACELVVGRVSCRSGPPSVFPAALFPAVVCRTSSCVTLIVVMKRRVVGLLLVACLFVSLVALVTEVALNSDSNAGSSCATDGHNCFAYNNSFNALAPVESRLQSTSSVPNLDRRFAMAVVYPTCVDDATTTWPHVWQAVRAVVASGRVVARSTAERCTARTVRLLKAASPRVNAALALAVCCSLAGNACLLRCLAVGRKAASAAAAAQEEEHARRMDAASARHAELLAAATTRAESALSDLRAEADLSATALAAAETRAAAAAIASRVQAYHQTESAADAADAARAEQLRLTKNVLDAERARANGNAAPLAASQAALAAAQAEALRLAEELSFAESDLLAIVKAASAADDSSPAVLRIMKSCPSRAPLQSACCSALLHWSEGQDSSYCPTVPRVQILVDLGALPLLFAASIAFPDDTAVAWTTFILSSYFCQARNRAVSSRRPSFLPNMHAFRSSLYTVFPHGCSCVCGRHRSCHHVPVLCRCYGLAQERHHAVCVLDAQRRDQAQRSRQDARDGRRRRRGRRRGARNRQGRVLGRHAVQHGQRQSARGHQGECGGRGSYSGGAARALALAADGMLQGGCHQQHAGPVGGFTNRKRWCIGREQGGRWGRVIDGTDNTT